MIKNMKKKCEMSIKATDLEFVKNEGSVENSLIAKDFDCTIKCMNEEQYIVVIPHVEFKKHKIVFNTLERAKCFAQTIYERHLRNKSIKTKLIYPKSKSLNISKFKMH
jgi:hypothetical protein